MDTIAERLRRAREAQGVTQAEVGRRLGVAAGTVAAWESGAVEPSVGTLRRWAEAVGMRLVVELVDR